MRATAGGPFSLASEYLSFASPKERYQRKGGPIVCVPKLRSGQPALLAFNGVLLNSLSLRQTQALIHKKLRYSAQSDGRIGQLVALLRSP